MRTVTFAQLKRLARLYADERPGGADAFIDEDELGLLINGEVANHWDLLIHAGGHERLITHDTALSTTANTATVDLPDDFYELVALHLNWGTRQLERVEMLDSLDDLQDIANLGVWTRGGPKCARINGAADGTRQLEFFPTPTTDTALDLRYVQAAPLLVAEADTLDGVNGWERMICYRVGAECLLIAGKSPTALMQLYQGERERIEILAHQSTASAPDRVRDVRYANRGNWRRLGPVPSGTT